MKVYILVLYIMFYLPLHSRSLKEYHVQPIHNLNDLPSQHVNCIHQDSDGYIWFGTSEGLCRYDGYSVRAYRSSYLSPDMLRDNMVTSITEDKRGRLWIGTTRGLNVFDRKKGKMSSIDFPPLAESYVNTILYTDKDQVWIGTENGLFLYKESEQSYETFLPDEENTTSITGNRIRALCETPDGDLWIGTWEQGLCRMNTETYHVTPYPRVSQRNCISTVFLDKENNLWLGAWAEGVYQVSHADNPVNVRYRRMNTDSRYERLIHTFIQDEKNKIWVGTGLGLDVIELSSSTYHTSDNEPLAGLPLCEINHLYVGTNGVIWIATRGQGVYQMFRKSRVFSNYRYDSLDDLKQPVSMNAFLEWGDDMLVGADKIGMARFDRNTEEMISCLYDPELKKIPFPMGNIKCMLEHPEKNELWLGSEYGGLILCRTHGQEILSAEQFYNPFGAKWLISNIVPAICYDQAGHLWIGTDKGLNIISTEQDTLIYDKRNLGRAIDIKCILPDTENRIWLGTHSDGIILADAGKGVNDLVFKDYNIKNDGIHINKVECLYKDSKQRIWAGGALSL